MQEKSTEVIWIPSRAEILFEDQDLIAINKPAGIASQATLDPKRHHLLKAVELYLRKSTKDPYAGLHHRLDRDTSGVIVLTKSRRANKNFAEQVSTHALGKTYVAISGTFPTTQLQDEWEVKNHVKKSHRMKGRMEVVRSGGDYAETKFTRLQSLQEALVIKAEPKTGRMHQIRVHLAGSAMPILGDHVYGTRATFRRAPRMMLHAWHLKLKHPITNKPLEIRAPLPEDMRNLVAELGGAWRES
jgi:23S rRNA pseudouridine955/2504/2580 synthase